MRCPRVRKMLIEYIDGDLSQKQNASIKKHLEECPDCEKLLQDFKKIANNAGKLEKHSPPKETWSKIEARINAGQNESFTPDLERRSWLSIPGFRYAAAAAGIVLIIAGAMILGPQYLRKEAESAGFSSSQEYTLAKLKEAEKHYQQAINALGEAVAAQEKQLDPKVAEVFKTNLKIINSSISACKQAVLSNPENYEPHNYLLAVYKEKEDLLSRIINLNGNIPLKGKIDTTI